MINLTRSILIVDDDKDDQLLIQMAFNANEISHTLEFFNHGQALVTYLERLLAANLQLPLFILLDINMPGINGIQVLQVLKSHQNLCCIPVIILSNSDLDSQIITCYNQGASSYLVKPLSFSAMVEMMNQLYCFWINMAKISSTKALQ